MEAVSSSQTSVLRTNLMKVYNQVNQEIFGLGVRKQKIEIYQDKIIYFSEHKRLPTLEVLTKNHPELVKQMDNAIVSEFKILLKEQLENEVDLNISTVLMAYDPKMELAVTTVYRENPLP
ncbi:Na-translocating system protein MpsC family protein [Bacillus sp. JJ1503]|uniref:Na-translocating system protein MpsC family protein n=1 Tax=Bacillus sp. JJ1503 TaxID=3122956 RepID=UPI002FFF51E3